MTFGPFYPRALLLSINHAESFCTVLARQRVRAGDPAAHAWLWGRRKEVECFVCHVGADFRAHRLGLHAASRAIDAYLASLHAGLSAHFGEHFPACCNAYGTPTVVVVENADLTPTTIYTPTRPVRRAVPVAGDVAPEDLLEGLETNVRW
jgi:hypothetical protein